jgi:hypothetical protein
MTLLWVLSMDWDQRLSEALVVSTEVVLLEAALSLEEVALSLSCHLLRRGEGPLSSSYLKEMIDLMKLLRSLFFEWDQVELCLALKYHLQHAVHLLEIAYEL